MRTRTDAARQGGRATVEKYGTEYMREIGRRGGKAISDDRAHMSQIGKLGGDKTLGRRWAAPKPEKPVRVKPEAIEVVPRVSLTDVAWVETSRTIYRLIRNEHDDLVLIARDEKNVGARGMPRVSSEWGFVGARYPLLKQVTDGDELSYYIAVVK
jgi:general stress protein YciG